MTVVHRRHIELLQVVAVGLLVTYGAITATVDLLHNHNDLVEGTNCPTCIWLQMSQNSDPGASPADRIISDSDVVAILSPPLEVGLFQGRDAISTLRIRAPPASQP